EMVASDTPDSAVSAKENPAITLKAQTARSLDSVRSANWVNERIGSDCVRVRILAIGHQTIRQGAHARRNISMQVEDAKERQRRRARQRTYAGQQLAFDILDRLRR